MIDWAIGHVPVKARGEAFLYIFVALAFVLGFATNLMYRSRYVTQIVHTHPSVSQLLGKPDQQVDGAQVNSALTGFVCDVYQRGVVYCHR